MRGYGQPGNDHIFSPNDPYYNTELPQRKLDRDKAKFHLNKAGMNNAKVELHVGDAAYGSVELGMLLQVKPPELGSQLILNANLLMDTGVTYGGRNPSMQVNGMHDQRTTFCCRSDIHRMQNGMKVATRTNEWTSSLMMLVERLTFRSERHSIGKFRKSYMKMDAVVFPPLQTI